MDINPQIFKEYDIRGIYPGDINSDIYYSFGNALALYLDKKQKRPPKGNPQIVIGRDVRLSSDELAEAFADGVRDYGFDVLDVGRVTSPMLFYAAGSLGLFGGAMITASHNPPEYNGLKLVKDKDQWTGAWVGGEELKEIYRPVSAESYRPEAGKSPKGNLQKIDISEDYINFVSKDFKINRKLKVVVDASGGAVGPFLPRFLGKLGVDYIPLFFEADGSFSKHSPNPTLEEAQRFAKEKIKETNADFGVIFDGDGDRMVVIDHELRYVKGDVVGAMIGESILKKGDMFVFDTISTRSIKKHFEEKGIKSLRGKIGHYYIKKIMKENNAVFGLESSSHYYYKSLFNAESSFYSFKLLLEALDKNPGSKISDLAEPFLKYKSSGVINIPIKSEKEGKEILKKTEGLYEGGKRSFEDGILVEFEDWWFNLRPSHTEPLIRLAVEAKNQETMEEKRDEILNFLEKIS